MVLTTGTISEIKQAAIDKIVSEFTYVVFGTGSFSGGASATSLGTELTTKARQDYQDLGDSVIISGYLGATEQNGNTITEVGAKDGASGNLQSGKNITESAKTSSNELWTDEEIELSITQTED